MKRAPVVTLLCYVGLCMPGTCRKQIGDAFYVWLVLR